MLVLQGPDKPRPPSMVLGEAPKMCLYSHMCYKIYKGEYFSILTHTELSPKAHKNLCLHW